jgi:predicted RNase H-like nuclease (RuvC/YqgF family)
MSNENWAIDYLEKSLQEKSERIQALEEECKGLREVIGKHASLNRELLQKLRKYERYYGKLIGY